MSRQRRAPDPDAAERRADLGAPCHRRERRDGRDDRRAARDQPLPFGLGRLRRRAAHWPFEALTYFGEDPAQRVAYLTLFPLPSGGAPTCSSIASSTIPGSSACAKIRPRPSPKPCRGSRQFTGTLRVKGPLKIRPVDLVATDNVLQPGIALVGDAFSTACPVSGTGAAKALLDAERLCNVSCAGTGSRRPAWAWRRSRNTTTMPKSAAPTRIRSAHPFSRSARRSARVCCGPRSAGAITRARRRGNFLEHGELAEMPQGAPLIPAARVREGLSHALSQFMLWAERPWTRQRKTSDRRTPGARARVVRARCATTSARRSRRWRMRCRRTRRSPSARPAASCARRGSAPTIRASRAAAA